MPQYFQLCSLHQSLVMRHRATNNLQSSTNPYKKTMKGWVKRSKLSSNKTRSLHELEEWKKDAEALAELIHTKCKVIKNLERGLVQAKKSLQNLRQRQSSYAASTLSHNSSSKNNHNNIEIPEIPVRSAPTALPVFTKGMTTSCTSCTKTAIAWQMHFVWRVEPGAPSQTSL